MDVRTLARVLTKTGGMLLAIYALSIFPSMYSSFLIITEVSPGLTATVLFAGIAVPLIVGLVLFFRPGTIANRVISGAADSPVGTPQLEVLILFGIGSYVFVVGIVDLSYWGYLLYLHRSETGMVWQFNTEQRAGVVATFLQIALGLALVFGRKGLVRAVRSARG